MATGISTRHLGAFYVGGGGGLGCGFVGLAGF